MGNNIEYDAIVIGTGAAGIAAAQYIARNGYRTLILDKGAFGGRIAITPFFYNHFGYPDVKGSDLAQAIKKHLEIFNVEIHELEGVEKISHANMTVKTNADMTYKAKAIILATGVTPKKINIPGETEYEGKGVSDCAVCDGPLYKGKDVAVIGSGDNAVLEALYLSTVAYKTYLISKYESLKCEPHLIKRIENTRNLTVLYSSEAIRIEGKESGVSRLYVKDLKTNEEKKIRVKAVFISIGHTPNLTLAKQLGLELTDGGLVKVNELNETSLPGIFAAGGIVTPHHQLPIAFASGTLAGIGVVNFLRKMRKES